MGDKINATAESPDTVPTKIKYITIDESFIDEDLKVINLKYDNNMKVRFSRDGRKLDDDRAFSSGLSFENPINKIKDFIGKNADDPKLNIEVHILSSYETEDGKYLFYYTDGSFVSVINNRIVIDTRISNRKYQSIKRELMRNYSELLDVSTDRFYIKPELTDAQKLVRYNKYLINLPYSVLNEYANNNTKRQQRLEEYHNHIPLRVYDPTDYTKERDKSFKDLLKRRQR